MSQQPGAADQVDFSDDRPIDASRHVFEVDISSMSPLRFGSVLSPKRFEASEQGVLRARELLAGGRSRVRAAA